MNNRSTTDYFLKAKNLGLERWLSGSEHLLLFKVRRRSCGGSQLPITNSSSRGSWVPTDISTQTFVCIHRDTHIYTENFA